MRMKDFQNDPRWKRSMGEKFGMTHFRNGHWHAECDPKTGYCSTHYDKYDPNKSPEDLIKHVWESDTGKAVIIGGVLVGAIVAASVYKHRKNRIVYG